MPAQGRRSFSNGTTPARCATSGAPTSAPSRRCCSRIDLRWRRSATVRARQSSATCSRRPRALPALPFQERRRLQRHLPTSTSTSCRLPTIPRAYIGFADQALRKRTQAMFDWWERIFDYTVARGDVAAGMIASCGIYSPKPARPSGRSGRPAPASGYRSRFGRGVLRYYQEQTFGLCRNERRPARRSLDDSGVARRPLASALDCHFAAKDMTWCVPNSGPQRIPRPGRRRDGNWQREPIGVPLRWLP